MKYVFLLLILAAANICCRRPCANLPTGKNAIEGIYTAFEDGFFCRTWDTLCIVRQVGPNQFLVTRMTCFQHILSDEYLPPERMNARWYGLYDHISHSLHAMTTGKDLQFAPQQNRISLTGLVYCRIE